MSPPANVRDTGDEGSIPESGRSPGGGHGNLLQCSCLPNPHGQRSLVGYSPWRCTELDTTEATQHVCTFIRKQAYKGYGFTEVKFLALYILLTQIKVRLHRKVYRRFIFKTSKEGFHPSQAKSWLEAAVGRVSHRAG